MVEITSDNFYEQVQKTDIASEVEIKRSRSKQKQSAKKRKPEKKPSKPSKKTDSQQVAGPSAIYISVTSSEDEEEDVGNDEPPCCVCKKHQPPTLNLMYTLEIVNWAQCDECGHWTHLKLCATERVLRRGDMFLCPCCRYKCRHNLGRNKQCK